MDNSTDIPPNATHWTPADSASSRRVYSLDRPGGGPVDTLDAHSPGDEVIEGTRRDADGRTTTWVVVERSPEGIHGPATLYLRRGEE